MFILLYKYKKIKWQITNINSLFLIIFCGKIILDNFAPNMVIKCFCKVKSVKICRL